MQRESLYLTLVKIFGYKTISWIAGNHGLHFFNVCVSSGTFAVCVDHNAFFVIGA